MPYDKLQKGLFLDHKVSQVSKTWIICTVIQLLNLVFKMIIFFAFSELGLISRSTILFTIITLIAMLLLLLLARQIKQVVHLFSILAMLWYFGQDYYGPVIDIAQYGSQFMGSTTIFLLSTSILSTSFFWSIFPTSVIFVIGSLIQYLRGSSKLIELEGGIAVNPEEGQVIKFALWNIAPVVGLAAIVSWVLFERELNSFFESKGEEFHNTQAFEVLEMQSDAILMTGKTLGPDKVDGLDLPFVNKSAAILFGFEHSQPLNRDTRDK